MRAAISRFDWYSATFDERDGDRVATVLATMLDATTTPGRARLGYATCSVVEKYDQALARVFRGSARAGEVHIVTTGDACDWVVPIVRELWPEHRVARADSAMDFSATFQEIDQRALAFAEERGLAHRLVTDSEGGATRYLGASTSSLNVRVYKKSEQLRRLYRGMAAHVPDDIVRVELQSRPQSAVKSRVARMSADEFWGLGAWTKDFAAEFLDLDTERVSTRLWIPSDWARSIHWMGQQYGPAVQRRIDQVGTQQAIAEVVESLGVRDG